MWLAQAGDRNRTRIQASCLPVHHTTLFITLLVRMLLVAGTKTTNHSSSGREGNFLAPSLMWTGGKMAMGMFTARIASTVVGAPHLCFFFFFLSYSLSLWVPQGGGVRMASSSTEAGNTSDPMGKLGIGLASWVTPLQVGARSGVSPSSSC